MKKVKIIATVSSDVKKYSIEGLSTYNTTREEEDYWSKVFSNYINDFILTVFGSSVPTSISVGVNKRLTSSQAQFVWYRNDRHSGFIEVSSRLVKGCCLLKDEQAFLKGVEAILKHEAIHYSLHWLREPYSDGDHMFETLISETRSVPSSSTNKKLTVKGSTIATVGFGYGQVCPECDRLLLTGTKSNRHYCISCSDPKSRKYTYVKGSDLLIQVTRNVEYGVRQKHSHALSLIKGNCKEIKPLARFIK